MKNRLLLISILITLVPALARATESIWDKAAVEYQGDKQIIVYRSPTCSCCHRWIEHLENHGFTVNDIQVDNVNPVKQQNNIPPQLASCHTAIIDGYFIEGHVPADDIKRLLLSRPDIRGLSVPAMPVGTPGMEMGDRKDDFTVIQLNADGSAGIFNEYNEK